MNKNNSQLRGHSLNLNKPHTNKSTKLRSFAMKDIPVWNCLPFRGVQTCQSCFSSSSKFDFFLVNEVIYILFLSVFNGKYAGGVWKPLFTYTQHRFTVRLK